MTRNVQELLDAEKAGTLDINTLTSDEAELLLSIGNEEETEVSQSEPEVKEETVEPASEESTKEEESDENVEPIGDVAKPTKPDRKATIKDLKKELYEKSNELNTYKQRYESLQRKIENGDVQPKKVVIDRDKMWQDDVVAERWEKLEAIEAKMRLLEQREQELEQQKKMDNIYRDIIEFQSKTPVLQTETDIREIDKIYNQIAASIKAIPTDKHMLEMGVKLTDVNKYRKLLQVDSYKRENGIKSYRGAFYDSGIADEFNSIPENSVDTIKKEKTVAGLEKVAKQPTLLKGGYTGSPTEWDDATVSKWLKANPDPTKYGKKEKDILAALMNSV